MKRIMEIMLTLKTWMNYNSLPLARKSDEVVKTHDEMINSVNMLKESVAQKIAQSTGRTI